VTRNKRNTRRRLTGLALAAIVGLAVLSRAGSALVIERPVGQPDAIIMLASHESERLPAAGALARQHPTSVVLLTVPKDITEYNCERCTIRTEWLGQEGVERTRVHTLPDRTANTRDEALAVLAYWRRNPFNRLAVVTSPYHTRRSLSLFETIFAGTGVAVGVYPAMTSPAIPSRWWFGSYDRGYVIYEWAALAYYRLKYGVPIQPSARDSTSMSLIPGVPE
jgi:uncharacterized SAM-binding protein YcdF (DUF218 family)